MTKITLKLLDSMGIKEATDNDIITGYKSKEDQLHVLFKVLQRGYQKQSENIHNHNTVIIDRYDAQGRYLKTAKLEIDRILNILGTNNLETALLYIADVLDIKDGSVFTNYLTNKLLAKAEYIKDSLTIEDLEETAPMKDKLEYISKCIGTEVLHSYNTQNYTLTTIVSNYMLGLPSWVDFPTFLYEIEPLRSKLGLTQILEDDLIESFYKSMSRVLIQLLESQSIPLIKQSGKPVDYRSLYYAL